MGHRKIIEISSEILEMFNCNSYPIRKEIVTVLKFDIVDNYDRPYSLIKEHINLACDENFGIGLNCQRMPNYYLPAILPAFKTFPFVSTFDPDFWSGVVIYSNRPMIAVGHQLKLEKGMTRDERARLNKIYPRYDF